ncbi:MAG: Fic family protein, partial [Deferrisomatales bacterium]
EAPPAERVPAEVARLLSWWDAEATNLVGMVRAGVAHLWFETIHPFEDGNGRVGRALADMALAQAERRRRRAYSLSAQIHEERDQYYRILEETQKGDGDITEWLVWFLGCVRRAICRSDQEVQKALTRARFWQQLAAGELNERQRKAVTRLLEVGPGGFEGGLTNQKYRGMTGASKVTATRDLTGLVDQGVLVPSGEGRASRYELDWARVGGDAPGRGGSGRVRSRA